MNFWDTNIGHHIGVPCLKRIIEDLFYIVEQKYLAIFENQRLLISTNKDHSQWQLKVREDFGKKKETHEFCVSKGSQSCA